MISDFKRNTQRPLYFSIRYLTSNTQLQHSSLIKKVMKIFAAFAAMASANSVVTEFCGFDLDETYGTKDMDLTYVLTKRKTWENRDPEKIAKKPRGPSHWRDVVRVECGPASRVKGQSRPQNEKPLGGYPYQKLAPMIKCTRKGPNGAQKLKPNSRRFAQSKIQMWYEEAC
ncbi:unnamed protein product [Oikopleura dioica]|uniref:Uncharacterized protein n=1 Tax=Oikopleura dioica TaxID=34765 RepID=E4XZR3_OIKDI|nr:unnamed protein product [Oikopleura dioica]